MCSPNHAGEDHEKHLLLFPPFHKRILSQSHWNACDDLGRIKVKLSAGYEIDGNFVKLVDHVIFSFQPAPLGRYRDSHTLTVDHPADGELQSSSSAAASPGLILTFPSSTTLCRPFRPHKALRPVPVAACPTCRCSSTTTPAAVPHRLTPPTPPASIPWMCTTMLRTRQRPSR
jgi:hypothetical protein